MLPDMSQVLLAQLRAHSTCETKRREKFLELHWKRGIKYLGAPARSIPMKNYHRFCILQEIDP